jgi:hypothetical protein
VNGEVNLIYSPFKAHPSVMSVFLRESDAQQALSSGGQWLLARAKWLTDTYNQTDLNRRQPYDRRSLPIGR